jgi:hypothetical protein
MLDNAAYCLPAIRLILAMLSAGYRGPGAFYNRQIRTKAPCGSLPFALPTRGDCYQIGDRYEKDIACLSPCFDALAFHFGRIG